MRFIELDFLGNPIVQRVEMKPNFLSTFLIEMIQSEIRRRVTQILRESRVNETFPVELIPARCSTGAATRQLREILFHLPKLVDENLSRDFVVRLQFELADLFQLEEKIRGERFVLPDQMLGGAFQTIGENQSVAVIVKDVLGEEDRLVQIDGQTKVSSVVGDGNRRKGESERRERLATGELSGRERTTGAQAQLEGDRTGAEGFVDHRHVEETPKEKKCAFQRESRLEEKNEINPTRRREKSTGGGKGIPDSF